MRFLVFLSGLDTAQSTAFILTHASNITTKYKKQNILNTVFVLRVRALIFSIMRYLVSMSHLLECSSESLSCMLVANPINLSSGRRSAPSDFSLPLFFLFFLRSAMIMVYLTDIPSAFVMHDSDAAVRLSAANSAIASTMMFVLARHKIAHAHLFKGLKDTRREEFTIKQNGPDVTAHAAAYCNQVAHKITHVLNGPVRRTPSTGRGPPSTHCAVMYLSNVPVPFFLLERIRSMPGFLSHLGIRCISIAIGIPSLQPVQARALHQDVHAQNWQNHSSSPSCQSWRAFR